MVTPLFKCGEHRRYRPSSLLCMVSIRCMESIPEYMQNSWGLAGQRDKSNLVMPSHCFLLGRQIGLALHTSRMPRVTTSQCIRGSCGGSSPIECLPFVVRHPRSVDRGRMCGYVGMKRLGRRRPRSGRQGSKRTQSTYTCICWGFVRLRYG